MLVLIGSKALRYYTDQIDTSIDTDVVGDYDSIVSYMKSQDVKPASIYPTDHGKKLIAKYPNKTIIEAEINWGHGSSQMLCDLVIDDPDRNLTGPIDGVIPSLDMLYTLKMSHRYLRNSPHFRKTMDHIHLMRKMGAKIRPEYKEFLKLREQETYHYAHPKLNVAKKDFFKDDGIAYVYDHDDIHKAIKHFDKPAYEYYSNAEVMCSKKLFFDVSEEIRLHGVLEEAYVLALERSQIPFKGQIEPRKSFDIALMKVCSSITSGWFREFGWENFYTVESMYNENYVQRFWDVVAAGKVAPYKKDI